jgi:flagellar biosynthesis chaperone FliJ
MKRFQFRAAKVLDWRRRQHDSALAELARRQEDRDAAAAAESIARQAVEDAQIAYRTCLVEGGDTATFERHRNWILGRRAEAESRRRLLNERQQEVERAAADVRRTHRQVLILENLRERELHDHQDEARRLENIDMDQLAVTQFARRM